MRPRDLLIQCRLHKTKKHTFEQALAFYRRAAFYKAAALRVNLNINGCSIVAPRLVRHGLRALASSTLSSLTVCPCHTYISAWWSDCSNKQQLAVIKSGPSPGQTRARGNRASSLSLDRPPGQRGILGGGLRGRVPGRSPPCWRVSCQHAHVDIAKECKNRGLLPRRLRSACVLCVCSKTCATCIRSKSSQSCSSCRRCRWHMHT